MMKNSAATKAGKGDLSASELIDRRIQELGDWRGETLGRVRALLKKVDPHIVEEWKWMGTPVFSRDGIVCTGETYKTVVKLTFAKGASLKDPARLFNSSLDGNVRRAIDLHENETLNEPALKALVREAIALNVAGKARMKTKNKTKNNTAKAAPGKPAAKPRAGGKAAKAKSPKASPKSSARPAARRKVR